MTQGRHIMSIRPTILVSTLLASTTLAPAAQAQATEQPQAETGQVGTIVVTARRREESLQDTPVAVSALSAAELENRQIETLTEVYRYVPNVQFSTAASGTTGASSVFVRGIGQIDFITTAEPGVGVYLDGVYLARVTGAALDLADVERVEVLRGPQGTLFGRNTIGGAVNVVTRTPREAFEGRLEISGGSQDRFSLMAGISGGLADGLAAGLTVMARTDSGYGTNLTSQTGSQQLGKAEDYAARLQLHAMPSDATTLDLAFDYLDHEGTPAPHTLVAFQPSAATAAYNAAFPANPIGAQFLNSEPDLDAVRLSAPMVDDLEVYGVAFTAAHDFDNVTLKSITSYRHQEGRSGQDFDGTPAIFLDQFIDSRQWQFSQEIQLSGEDDLGRLNWILGGYYFAEDGRFNSSILLSGTPITILTNNHTESWAGYGQLSYELFDDFRVTLGARYTDETKRLDGVTTNFGGFVLVPPTDLSDSFDNFSPKIGIDYRVSDDLLLYASATRGFRSGGFNGRPFSPADLTSFDAETVTSYEVGFKSELADRRIRFNAAAFYNDYTDIQLTAVTNSGGATVVRTGNAATAEIYGFEAELEARPTNALTLFGSVGFLENSLEEKTGFTFGATELPTSPEWTISAGGRYDADLTDTLVLSFGADYSYTSSFTPQFDPSPAARIPAYSLVNASITLNEEADGWRITLFAENLFDQAYRTYAQTSGSQDVTVAWFGPTRRLGVELGFEF
ncbi:TonB-dependent receptor [Parasphingopyxis algicola]|uniref:TonB-dependent receptor n=1 Tax=Parasphingopyxis algicola TaxID=2026624 RepID=UPI0031B5725C